MQELQGAEKIRANGDVVIENLGRWDWSLFIRDSFVAAVKPIPHEGQIWYSTNQEWPTDSHSRSEHGLTVHEVVSRYKDESDTDTAWGQLYTRTMDALEHHADGKPKEESE